MIWKNLIFGKCQAGAQSGRKRLRHEVCVVHPCQGTEAHRLNLMMGHATSHDLPVQHQADIDPLLPAFRIARGSAGASLLRILLEPIAPALLRRCSRTSRNRRSIQVTMTARIDVTKTTAG